MYNRIKNIQKSGDVYTIIECGTSAIVSNTLMSCPGASSMISECYQPYSKNNQVRFLESDFKRSVSIEWILLAFKKIEGPCFITQYQTQSGDKRLLTHGYIGIRGKNGTRIYHQSIYNSRYNWDIEHESEEMDKRISILNLISDTSLNIIESHSVEKKLLSNLSIDAVYDENGNFLLEETLEILGGCDKTDMMFVYDGSWSRMEDLVRDQKGIIIERGSFNPLHVGHVEMMKLTQKEYPYKGAFLISMNNFDKPPVNPLEAIERAKAINKLGYPVIFSAQPYFNNSSNTISGRWPDLEVIYPVGYDTINRYIKSELDTDKDLHNRIVNLSTLKNKEIGEYTTDTLMSTWKLFHGNDWNNHRFRIFKRSGNVLMEESKFFKSIIEEDTTWTDTDSISSTKIRDKKI